MGVTPAIAADEPFRLKVNNHGKTIKVGLSTFCEVAPEGGYCSDSAYPLETRPDPDEHQS